MWRKNVGGRWKWKWSWVGVGVGVGVGDAVDVSGAGSVCLSDVGQGRRKGCRHGMGMRGDGMAEFFEFS